MFKFLSLLTCSLFISGAIAATTSPIELVEGKDYTILSAPVQKTVEPAGKVNVKEFFSYTCIHCKDIEPLVEQGLAKDKAVDLNQIQVNWDGQDKLAGYVKLSATIQALGYRQLNDKVFNALFANKDLSDDKKLKQFLVENGLNEKKVKEFMDMYNSFSIASKPNEYKDLTKQYNIAGTPTFIVADKYVVSPAVPARLILVVQELVKKVQKETGTTAKSASVKSNKSTPVKSAKAQTK